ncbi:unnamed protein product [Xylocopa violacea]|uniref:Uncharacterized protein n=1 Tax=Xylocopa violacea TaxID=135666 RepID=A0ABP1P5S7_XYLVO
MLVEVTPGKRNAYDVSYRSISSLRVQEEGQRREGSERRMSRRGETLARVSGLSEGRGLRGRRWRCPGCRILAAMAAAGGAHRTVHASRNARSNVVPGASQTARRHGTWAGREQRVSNRVRVSGLRVHWRDPHLLQRSPLVLLQPFNRNGLQPDPRRRILLEDVPHVLLAEDEEVRVAHRAHAGCSPVTCVDVAIYWLSRCVKLSLVSARNRSTDRSFLDTAPVARAYFKRRCHLTVRL